MRDGMHILFQKEDIFHYFRAFKTEILHINLRIGQISTKTIIPLSVGDHR